MQRVSEFEQTKTFDPDLSCYIDNYVYFYHPSAQGLFKKILPCPGISLLFNFRKMGINGSICPDVTLIGLHENVYHMETFSDVVDTVIVRFSPWGFRQFMHMPASCLTQKILDASQVFGESLVKLYAQMKAAKSFAERIGLMDTYFKAHLMTPVRGYETVAKIAEKLREAPEPVSFTALYQKNCLTLSPRQMTRWFKEIIGINLQAYIRICRFGLAKSLIYQNQYLSLTEVGYLSGYYDQPHFSREFKKLSGLNAKDLFPHCALQKMLHEKMQ